MPIAYTEIDEQEIVNILASRGYGRQQMRRFALAFNKPTGERYQSGGEKRVFAFGLTHEQLAQIKRYSESAEDAANRAERFGLTGEAAPQEQAVVQEYQAKPGLTLDLAEKLIVNRVAAEVGRVMPGIVDPLHDAFSKLQTRLAALEAVAVAASSKRPRGRPKGSKNKPKPPEEAV